MAPYEITLVASGRRGEDEIYSDMLLHLKDKFCIFQADHNAILICIYVQVLVIAIIPPLRKETVPPMSTVSILCKDIL